MLYFNSGLSSVKDDNHRPIKWTPNPTVTWYDKWQHCRQLSHTNCEMSHNCAFLGYHKGTNDDFCLLRFNAISEVTGILKWMAKIYPQEHNIGPLKHLYELQCNGDSLIFCYFRYSSFSFLPLFLELHGQMTCTFSNISNNSYWKKKYLHLFPGLPDYRLTSCAVRRASPVFHFSLPLWRHAN